MNRFSAIFGMALALVLGAAPAVSHDLTKSDVEAWLDGYVPDAMEHDAIPGAVVVVVKNGEILAERGFGYADLAEHKPVDPALTLFRPGSISKLFTWTAVMQLVEQGKIDLDAPVNQYLDFKLPNWNGKQITMRNLMTHTPGLEDGAPGPIVDAPAPPFTLGGEVKKSLPLENLIYEPGTVPAYSNYGAAVAGYIVERLSGEKFEDYIQKHIFEPLHMEHATFVQPLPDNLKPLAAEGYAPNARKPSPFEIITMPPAGAMSISGEDMAKFLIAHLHHGEGILKPETADMMHSTTLTIMPGVDRMALGFYELNHNGHRIIGHGGGTNRFHSLVTIMLDDDVGIFTSFNSPGADGLSFNMWTRLVQRFMDRYFPAPRPDTQVDAKDAAEHAKMMVGAYMPSRHGESTYRSIVDFITQQTVSLNDKGHIVIGSNNKVDWVEIAPFVWMDKETGTRLGAKVVDGKVAMWGIDPTSPYGVRLPVPWYKQSSWLSPAIYLSLALFVMTALFWPVSAVMLRHHNVSQRLTGHDLLAYRAIGITSILGLAWFVAWIFVLREGGHALIYTAEFASWTILPCLVAAALGNAFLAWTGRRSVIARGWSILFLFAATVMLWFAVTFRLFYIGVA